MNSVNIWKLCFARVYTGNYMLYTIFMMAVLYISGQQFCSYVQTDLGSHFSDSNIRVVSIGWQFTAVYSGIFAHYAGWLWVLNFAVLRITQWFLTDVLWIRQWLLEVYFGINFCWIDVLLVTDWSCPMIFRWQLTIWMSW